MKSKPCSSASAGVNFPNASHRPETRICLTAGRIDIFICGVDRPSSEIICFEALLSPEELSRAQRFRYYRDRDRYVVQHGLLRQFLAGYLGDDPRQVDIRTHTDGKPYLAGDAVDAIIYFSISRSDAVAAFAFSRTGSIGIDIEKIRDIPEMIEIAARHFTQGENCEIFSCPKSMRSAAFMQIWARKEAVLKAQGQGLLRPLDSVDLSTQGNSREPWKVIVGKDGDSEGFWITDIAGSTGFSAAVAVAGIIGSISVHKIVRFDGA